MLQIVILDQLALNVCCKLTVGSQGCKLSATLIVRHRVCVCPRTDYQRHGL